MNILTKTHPATEQLRFFISWLKDIVGLRRYDEQNYVAAARQIAEENYGRWQQTAIAAHKAETYDGEAVKLLDAVLADGRVDESEVLAVKKARAMAQHSARCDHDASELAKVDAV